MSHATLEGWEAAEVARSRYEAERVAAAIHRTSPRILERYAHPSATTPYPLEYLFHRLGDVHGKDVLDYGCGDGRDATMIAHRGARVSALDISPHLLHLAEQRLRADGMESRVTLLCGSAHDIPLPDASVDVVWGNAVLHHLDLELAAREVHRVLRPGGRAVFKEPMRNSRVLAAIRKLIPYRQPDISPFERPLRYEEIRTFASRFRGLDATAFTLPFVPAIELLKAPATVQQRTYALDARMLATLPLLRTYATVLVFEVTK